MSNERIPDLMDKIITAICFLIIVGLCVKTDEAIEREIQSYGYARVR